MASDVTGTMVTCFPEQGRGSTDLARALTVLQVGIEILPNALTAGCPDIDRRALVETLTAAVDRATGAIAALVETTSPSRYRS